jgi:hypothetical protein
MPGPEFQSVGSHNKVQSPSSARFSVRLTLRNLAMGDARISVMVSRPLGEVSINVIEREGDIQVVTTA